jgi:hypothetical protein
MRDGARLLAVLIGVSLVFCKEMALMVMTYHRPPALGETLTQLLAQGGERFPLIVAQSADSVHDPFIPEVRAVLNQFGEAVQTTELSWPSSTQRIPQPLGLSADSWEPDTAHQFLAHHVLGGKRLTCASSRPTSGKWPCILHVLVLKQAGQAQEHGSKLESSRNLMGGLLASLSLEGVGFVGVLEDDVQLSGDALHLLEATMPLLGDETGEIEFLTTQALLRPGLLWDMDGWVDTSLRSTREGLLTDREGAWSVADPARILHYDLKDDECGYIGLGSVPLACRVDIRRGTPRLVFRTFFWMASRTGVLRLASLLWNIVNDPTDGTGSLSDWCAWCDQWCYDHAIEALLQGKQFLVPVLPRSTSYTAEGMSGPLSASDEGRGAFHTDHSRHSWGVVLDDARMTVTRVPLGWAGQEFWPQPRPTRDIGRLFLPRQRAMASETLAAPLLEQHALFALVLREPFILLVSSLVLSLVFLALPCICSRG